ncbi:MAG: DUF2007 domain-containing protein [Planctomycetia bacterium]|nr:DUF2007 domain-containing protein [Planctomycetia bacterium]
MALRNPVAAYIAASNIEAHLLKNLLIDAGIEAAVEEDVSQIGVWWGGLASQLHRPKVWIEQSETNRAAPILEEFERQESERRLAERQPDRTVDHVIRVTCEECEAQSEFPTALQGTVQFCPKCAAYVDVGDDQPDFDWEETGGPD